MDYDDKFNLEQLITWLRYQLINKAIYKRIILNDELKEAKEKEQKSRLKQESLKRNVFKEKSVRFDNNSENQFEENKDLDNNNNDEISNNNVNNVNDFKFYNRLNSNKEFSESNNEILDDD